MIQINSRAARPVALFAISLAIASCGQQGGHGGMGGGMPPTPVAVQEIQPHTVAVQFEYPAQTAGSREAEVRARVSGILLKRNYEEGATVREGQSLFTLDSAPYEAAVARAEADVSSAEAKLNNASRNFKRMKPLFDAKAASQKDLDDATSGQEVAAADLKSATARLADARRDLAYTKVESPITGVTSRSLKSEGTLIAGPQDLLTTVSQVDPIWVNFGLSEGEQAALKRDAAAGKLILPKDGRFDVSIRFEDGREYSRSGRLVFTDIRVNAQTGTSDARAEIANPGGDVHPGQFVRISLKGATRPNAITVPQRAVQEGPQGKVVYLFTKENKAEPRPVVLGDWTGADWIVLNGLAPGDKVITDGLMKVMMMPGAPLVVGDPNAPPPGAPGGAPGKDGAPPPKDAKK
ncbi:MAG TPA: efflux RND transporter periplasmic adaptor subunit [Usitatibacter sp.]|nr:efflux RND transporter periplasmic adaptor subunit [Usitatibacter sp.]